MIEDLNTFLSQNDLILSTTPGVGELVDETMRRARERRISVMYGETYDRHGLTLDSLKYYFTVAAITNILRSSGAHIDATILIGDIATCRNEQPENHDDLMAIGVALAERVRAISGFYGLNLEILLMSEYLNSAAFQERLARIRVAADEHPEIEDYVVQTVPANKVEIERAKGFAYAFEEIATIVEYDIKIGPPREQFYDDPARLIARSLGRPPLLSVYLHPTYPLGLGVDFFFANDEIERYGVTPYKANSKKLAAHRIVLGETPNERIDELIDTSFVGRKPGLPNPVLDLAVIGELARQLQGRELEELSLRENFYGGALDVAGLKMQAKHSLRTHIIEPLSRQTLTAASVGKGCSEPGPFVSRSENWDERL